MRLRGKSGGGIEGSGKEEGGGGEEGEKTLVERGPGEPGAASEVR